MLIGPGSILAAFFIRNFAGGYAKDNKKSSTIVTYANGVTKKSLNLGIFTISPKVKPGSTIKVVSEHKVKRRKKEEERKLKIMAHL